MLSISIVKSAKAKPNLQIQVHHSVAIVKLVGFASIQIQLSRIPFPSRLSGIELKEYTSLNFEPVVPGSGITTKDLQQNLRMDVQFSMYISDSSSRAAVESSKTVAFFIWDIKPEPWNMCV